MGADVDSQELWIAATIGDAAFAGIHGSTALGWMNLEGKKSDGTDMHSKTASLIGISRDHAKVFNYGRIYGAGLKFAVKLLMQFNPNMTEQDARKKALHLYESTKGKKVKIDQADNKDTETGSNEEKDKNNQNDSPQTMWSGGSESEMFNKLEEIARSNLPETPVLNARITRTLEPGQVKDDVTCSLN